MNDINPDQFLMGGSKSASFLEIGATLTGTISEPPVLQQQKDMKTGDLQVWPDGNPKMQLVVTLDTDQRDPEDPDDDGKRRLFVKSGLKAAVARAVRSAGATRLEVGGKLTVTYTGDGKQEKRGFNPPKQYSAEYVKPVDASLGVAEPPAEAPAEPPAGIADALKGANLSPEAMAALKGLIS